MKRHCVLLLLSVAGTQASFVAPALRPSQRAAAGATLLLPVGTIIGSSSSVLLARFDDEIEDVANRRAAERSVGEGGGELAAGAILGGLLLGPFGALFGAQIGANMGSRRAFDRARQEEMERMGITEDMLQMATQIGQALEEATAAMKVSQSSLETQQTMARRLEGEAETLKSRAQNLLQASNSDEVAARQVLLERQSKLDRLKSVLKGCAEERSRYSKLRENVEALEDRAMEIDTLLRRAVSGAAARRSNEKLMEQDFLSGTSPLALDDEDPLLQKFRDLGIR